MVQLNDVSAVVSEGILGDDRVVEKPKWINDMGSWNNVPTPIRETSIDEFWQMMNLYSPSKIEHRQVHGEQVGGREGSYINVKIFWFPTSALLMVLPNKWTCVRDGSYPIHYTDAPRFYTIGCQHEMRSLTKEEIHARGKHEYRCYHYEICTKCGMEQEYDSSD